MSYGVEGSYAEGVGRVKGAYGLKGSGSGAWGSYTGV